MFNSLDVLDDLVPVSELSNGRTAAVLNKADRAPVIIIKRNKPSYVLMGINDYQDLLDRLEDTEDASLAEKRIEDNNGRATIPNADLMAELADRRGHRGYADPGDGVSWRVEWLEEAAKDMRKLGKAEQKQVLKGIAKVSENPLPSSQGGYGKPLRNANRAHLAGLCKIKFRDLGIRVVYKPVLKEGTMVIIVVGVRTDGEAYLKADERRGRHAL